jgi:hypothetical protein
MTSKKLTTITGITIITLMVVFVIFSILNINYKYKQGDSYKRVYLGWFKNKLFPTYSSTKLDWSNIDNLKAFCSRESFEYTNEDRYLISKKQITCTNKKDLPEYFSLETLCIKLAKRKVGIILDKFVVVDTDFNKETFDCHYSVVT